MSTTKDIGSPRNRTSISALQLPLNSYLGFVATLSKRTWKIARQPSLIKLLILVMISIVYIEDIYEVMALGEAQEITASVFLYVVYVFPGLQLHPRMKHVYITFALCVNTMQLN